MKRYDLAIIGGGPGGLTAAIYALRSGLSTVIIEKAMIGGQTSLTGEIENYPGILNINGMELTMKMHEQATHYGVVTLYGEVKNIEFKEMNNVLLVDDEKICANTIILSMGAKARTLNVPGEAELTSRGVCYCAVCDGAIYRGRDVVLVGAGNSALEDAIYLSNICKTVTIINYLPKFKAQDYLIKELEKQMATKNNIKIIYNANVSQIIGEKQISAVKYILQDKEEELNAQGVFIAIGRTPDTALVKDLIELNERGYILTNEKLETNMPGVFAAGDVRVKDLRQIITASADGAIAATNAKAYINKNK